MKRYLSLIAGILFSLTSFANHITGGEIYYRLVSSNGTTHRYEITLKLFRDHFSTGAALDAAAAIGIFNRLTGTLISNNEITRTAAIELQLVSPSPCISNPPVVYYDVGYYTFTVDLPAIPEGYIIAYQRCCRINGINNLSNSSNAGATYTAEIPGTDQLATAPANNSAHFIGPDTVIVCANNSFQYSFAATDADGDLLTYSFCNAYLGGSSAPGQSAPNPPDPPPYPAVPYVVPFNGSSPLGSTITVNPATGLISGIAPAAGIYVVTVCVTEIRNGIPIAVQRKDLQIKIGDCTIAKASLAPQYISCIGPNAFTLNFQNQNSSPLINSYFWDFGVTTLTNDTSDQIAPTYTYPDSGTFVLKLVTNRNQQCSDSTTAVVKVYPGFAPGFTVTGTCINNPISFRDTTRSRYGTVNSWSWNFGDLNTLADTAHIRNPNWLYSASGTMTAQLIVTDNRGCIDTISKTVDVLDKPKIGLAFKDTLICVSDQLQLQASGNGVFSWTPLVNIINANTATPTVSPVTTTTYYVNLNENGCINNDSVRVRVVSFVSLQAINDTTICQGDSIRLNAISNGLQFLWSPAANLSNPNIINPMAVTNSLTTYTVLARIGSCTATDQVIVSTVPYPVAVAGPDTTLCYNSQGLLHGRITGSRFTWTPAQYLGNPNSLTTTVNPPRTTSFILTSYDTLGCPKPKFDTLVVTVLPRIRPFAGHDTVVIVGQPLHLNASGGTAYQWFPGTWLNNPRIPNPTGLYDGSVDSVRYKLLVSDAAGCTDSSFMTVRVFRTVPYIFVPTAFTPNGDGLNDVVRPIGVGIEKIEFFSIYNRWGQLVFTTSVNGAGWNGKVGGVLQGSNTYAWMVSAIDYTGRKLFLKGTTTLIR